MRKAIKGEYAHPDRGGDAKKFQMLQKAYESACSGGMVPKDGCAVA